MGFLMGFLGRLLKSREKDRELKKWRVVWREAVANPDPITIRNLRLRLDQLAAGDDELEIEREMLDGLERVTEFASTVAERGLPAVATGHRSVGADICHFTAPASMPDDPAQPSGRLLLTNVRAVFVGGTRGFAVAWYSVIPPLHDDRDVVLVRADGTATYRFRFNSYSDALCGAFIARQLVTARHVRTSG